MCGRPPSACQISASSICILYFWAMAWSKIALRLSPTHPSTHQISSSDASETLAGAEENSKSIQRIAFYVQCLGCKALIHCCCFKLLLVLQTVIFYTPNTPNTPPVLGPHPQLSLVHDPTQSSVYIKKLTLLTWLIIHLLWNCIEDPYCPVTVLLAIAIQCFALFTRFQIMHKIWKLCMKFGHLILGKIFKFVATGCEILRPKCTKINFALQIC